MFFLASSHTKNSKSEKTNKHTICLIYPKKRFEHMLFSKVIIIAFAHKKSINIILFYVSVSLLILLIFLDKCLLLHEK
jgi:hypothetical protein